MDTHTAVASAVYQKYLGETGDKTKTIIASTASPFKFTRSVMQALGNNCKDQDDLELADSLAKLAGIGIPEAVEELRTAPVLHDRQCDISEMETVVKEFLGI